MTDPPGEHQRNDVLAIVAVAATALFLAWTAWTLTRGEWRAGLASGFYILKLARAIRLGTAFFLVVALHLSARSTVSKLQNRVSRLSLASWNRRQFAILSPLVFLFAYLNFLLPIPLMSPAINQRLPRIFNFWQYWHATGASGLSLVTTILSINVLVAVYLWLSFRSYRASIRRTGVVLYLPYVLGLLLLVVISDQYYKISQVSPDFFFLEYPSLMVIPR